MSSAGESFTNVQSSHVLSSENETPQQSRTTSRQQSRTPGTPRKRRRVESVEPSRIRKYYLEGKYSDSYRVLFNEEVSRAATRFAPSDEAQHHNTQYGVSRWSGKEQATFFVALERLGRDDIPGIAQAVGTKSIPEIRELLLLLDDAAIRQKDVGLKLRDIPAAIEVSKECTEELDVMAEALAWYQEQFEVAQEQERYGDYWLISPVVADSIEIAVNSHSRAASICSTTPAEPDTPRTGPGIAGSCVRCKQQKIRCDRKVPCTNCARMKKKVVCEYQPSKRNTQSIDLTQRASKVDEVEEKIIQPVVPTHPQILQAIPQASLLHAQNMLLLSKNLFMNRSPDISSPWPHWSAYVSDQVPEPSILRTAFNDFHTLAVSVTRRLMQSAIMQATSRLRSQRRRTKKGVMPLVKTRDVHSAIDILGLKRNGRSRWTGVARRCNVRVLDERRTTRFKVKRREISWDQAEHILGLYDAVTVPSASGVTASEPTGDIEDDIDFKRRAVRSGTPLPIEQLSLSGSDPVSEIDNDNAEYNSSLSDGMEEVAQSVPQTRDNQGRYTSLASGQAGQRHRRELQTLEEFDRAASRQEEEALCNLLGLSASPKRMFHSNDESLDDELDGGESLITSADGWRNWTEYQAPWEVLQTSVPAAKFIANQKPHETTSAINLSQLQSIGATSADDSDASSISSRSSQRIRQSKAGVVELRARNPRVYAAIQTNAFGTYEESRNSDTSSSDDLDADSPAQSVEQTGVARNSTLQEVMDWEM